MRSKLVAVAVGAAFAVLLVGATSASAATEVGNRCTVNESNAATSGKAVAVSLANAPGSPLPAAIPSAGVITRWTFSISLPNESGFALTETLKVFRPTGVPQQLQVVGESAPGIITGGMQAFPTRIPVKAGDLIGAVASLGGETGSIFCKTEVPGDRLGFVAGAGPVGSSSTITTEEGGHQNPIVVFVEPDADNDGFGDETQDACPQSATTQAPCPVVTLSTTKQVRKGSVTIVVTTSTQATITVKGVAKLGKGKKAKLSGGTQILAPGLLGKFRLGFSKALKNKLKKLPPKRSVRLNVTVSGTSVSGAVTKKTLKLKLKGQAKP